jgi:hypothetical protein
MLFFSAVKGICFDPSKPSVETCEAAGGVFDVLKEQCKDTTLAQESLFETDPVDNLI